MLLQQDLYQILDMTQSQLLHTQLVLKTMVEQPAHLGTLRLDDDS